MQQYFSWQFIWNRRPHCVELLSQTQPGSRSAACTRQRQETWGSGKMLPQRAAWKRGALTLLLLGTFQSPGGAAHWLHRRGKKSFTCISVSWAVCDWWFGSSTPEGPLHLNISCASPVRVWRKRRWVTWHCSRWCNNKHQLHIVWKGKERKETQRKEAGDLVGWGEIEVGGWRGHTKCCNECAVISAVLISLFVYFSPHLPRHAVPQCFPSSLTRSCCCALMHVPGWCSCPGRSCLFVCAARCVDTLAYFFLLIKLLRRSDTSCVSADSSCFWPFCRTREHEHTSHAHVSAQAGDGWCYYLKLLRGREVLKRTNTPDCLCFIIRN